MSLRTLIAVLVAVASVLACGGGPVKIEVGDAKFEMGAEEDAASVAPAPPPGSPSPSPPPAARSSGSGPGQIQLTTGRMIDPRVDGVKMVGTGEGWFAEVQPGRRTVAVYNLVGKLRAQTAVQVRSGRRHVVSWDGKQLEASGEAAMGRMPAAVSFDSEVTISGLLVMDSSTTVDIGRCAAKRVAGKDAFRCAAVPPGRQPVHIRAGGFDLYDGPIQVGLGGQTSCTFVLGSGAWVPDCTHYP